jgi:hypothetical protein
MGIWHLLHLALILYFPFFILRECLIRHKFICLPPLPPNLGGIPTQSPP